MEINLDIIQAEHLVWASQNFPEATTDQAVLGVCEEVGELAHAQLKLEQSIRGNEEKHLAEARDAVGDICIFLLHWCNLMGCRLSDILGETWGQVKQRDWATYPENGRDK